MISIIALPLLALAPFVSAAPASAPAASHSQGAPNLADGSDFLFQDRHGRVDWFEGDHDAALAAARAADQPVLLSFYTDNTRCRTLDREAYCDDRVVEALAPVVCVAIDVDTHAGKAVRALYPTGDYYPALVFLDANGELRDRILGYKDTNQILGEIQRILADEDTLGDLRRKSDAKPGDLLALWDYALKLERLDQDERFAAAVERLRSLDPEETSLPLRSLKMRTVVERCNPGNDYAPLRSFLAEETYAEILFDGWLRIASYERMQAKEAMMADKKELGGKRYNAFHRARFKAWPHCPPEMQATFCNNIAWDVYKYWAVIPEDLRQEAIAVARHAVTLEPKAADILDTLACLLFSDGQVDEAIRLMRQCIQLEPDSDIWEQRLEMFEREEA